MMSSINDTPPPLPRLGLGASRIGSFNNPQPMAAARSLIRAAIDMGVTLVDTSNIYGQGDSETQIGRAIEGRRDAAFIVTKTGKGFSAKMRMLRPIKPLVRPLLAARRRAAKGGPGGGSPGNGGSATTSTSAVTARRENEMRQDWRPTSFAPSLEASLKRLKTDRVDGFLLHSPSADVVSRPDVGEALVKLQREGKLREFGVSCDDMACFRASLTMAGLTLLQLPWDVIVALSDDDAALLRDRGIRVLAREVIRQQPGVPPIDAARRAVAHPVVDTVLVGTTSEVHLRALVDGVMGTT